MYIPSNLPPRSEWTREHYQQAIQYNRRKAQGKRQQAANHDSHADQLAKECAKFSTEKLPLFECNEETQGTSNVKEAGTG